MFKNKIIFFLTMLVGSVLVLVSFQNCSPMSFHAEEGELASALVTIPGGASSASSDNSVTTGEGTGGGDYSEKCDDYAAKGWASKEDCLKDGNWHLVVVVPPGGTPTPDSVDDLTKYIEEGTDVKVIIPEQRLSANGSPLAIVTSGNEECQQVYRSQSGSRPIYCLTTARFSGESVAEASQGSARYGTDGSLFCNGLRSPGRNGCSGLDPLTYKWYIRY